MFVEGFPVVRMPMLRRHGFYRSSASPSALGTSMDLPSIPELRDCSERALNARRTWPTGLTKISPWIRGVAASAEWRRSPTGILGAMQIDIPDPGYTGSARARANFRLALKLSAGFVALLWLILLLGWGLELQRFGVRPRQWIGLIGILVAPMLHADVMHLIANSVPLIVLGTAMFHLYPRSAFRVLPAVYLGPGIAVWFFGQDGIHLGASGLVYGLVAYIFVAGLIRRDRRAIAASMLVAFMYGALAWGVLPIRLGISWETHLAAAVIGVLMAIILRGVDNPPRVRYEWEGETGESEQTQTVDGDFRPGS
jgi:membrane associated rhomboid family serine protease